MNLMFGKSTCKCEVNVCKFFHQDRYQDAESDSTRGMKILPAVNHCLIVAMLLLSRDF